MDIIWGILLIAFGLIAWGGQVLSAVTPRLAEQLGLIEPEADVDPAFYADARGEAKWDSINSVDITFSRFTNHIKQPIMGLLWNGWWKLFILYFAGRAIFTRLELKRNGVRIGNPELLKIYFIFATLWGLIGLATIIKAVKTLSEIN